MVNDIKLTADFDLDIQADGATNTVTGRDAIAQDVRVLLATEQGSHFLWRDLGIDRASILSDDDEDLIAGRTHRSLARSLLDTDEITITLRSQDKAQGTIDYAAAISAANGDSALVEGTFQ